MIVTPGDHGLEEIRAVALDLLSRREHACDQLTQYQNQMVAVGEVFTRPSFLDYEE